MYYSITFDGNSIVTPSEALWLNNGTLAGTSRSIHINTWDDWHLIPTSRPTIVHPMIEMNLQDINGLEGQADYTEYITGQPEWNDRKGSFEFYVANGYENWKTIRENIIYSIHGKRLRMTLEEDPTHWYIGRFTLSDWKSEANWSKVNIGYQLEPYKYIYDQSQPPQAIAQRDI